MKIKTSEQIAKHMIEPWKLYNEDSSYDVGKAYGTCEQRKLEKWVSLNDVRSLRNELSAIKKVRDVIGRKHNELVTERNEALEKIKNAKELLALFWKFNYFFKKVTLTEEEFNKLQETLK
jgi:hypothetical protein